MNILGQSSLLISVTSFSLGFSVLARNVRNILFLSFAIMTTLISGWALAFYLEQIWPGMGCYRVHLFLNILLSPSILFFMKVMARAPDRFSWRIFHLSMIASVCLCICTMVGWEKVPFIRQMIYFSPFWVVVQILYLIWKDRRSAQSLANLPKISGGGSARRYLIYAGAITVLSTCVLDHVPWVGQGLAAFGNLMLTAYLFFLSQAITQQRLLNIHALFSRLIVLVVVAFTLTIIYLLLVGWIENSPGLFFLNSFIVSFVILMLLDPLRSFTLYFTQRLLTKKHRSLEQTLLEGQSQLSAMVDLGTLFQAMVSTIEQILQPEGGALFILTVAGTKFRKVRMIENEGTLNAPLREVIAHHPLLEYCRELVSKGQFPVLLDQILETELDRSASRTQREKYSQVLQGLKVLGSNLLIPLIAQRKVLGFLAVKISHLPEPWRNNWEILTIIYPYFQQAAQVMQNMEIFTRQREKERLAALGEMAAGLAHEIRNPLGAIKGAAQYLDPQASPTDSRFLQVIIEEVDRLNRVVTQFLDYSKPTTQEFSKLDLSQLVQDAVSRVKPGVSPQITFEFNPSPVPAMILGSAEQLHQVMVNFIQNSERALENRSPSVIRLSVSVDLVNGDRTFTVEDTGRGIKKDHLEKIFIPFFTTSPRGTGLGLPISQKIIEAHRGRIEVLSEEGRFTRVSVILPMPKE